MNLRLVQYSIDDLIVDHENVAAGLNRALYRSHRHWRVAGCCQTEQTVIFTLEPQPAGAAACRYVLAPFSGLSQDEVIADVHSRWQGGFVTRGLLRLGEVYLGLFEARAKPPTVRARRRLAAAVTFLGEYPDA